MSITSLQRLLTTPTDKLPRSQVIFWLSLSLTFSAIYSLLALQIAFSSDYLVDSDARQHVFWMQRFLDPTLFPNDLITDYHQSIAPAGYTALYRIMAALGINPWVFNKVVPTILGLITTGYCFGTCLQLLPIPVAGFTASLLLNQTLWTTYTLVSGTPRAFVYPIVLAFLYYLLQRSLLPCLGAIALLGLFYPQYVFICAGVLILQIWRWQGWQPRLSGNRRDYWFCIAGLGVAFVVLLPYALQSNEFAPVITGAEARTLPEFLPDGRTPFFDENPWEFWLFGKRSSLLGGISLLPLLWLGLLLPFLLRYPSRFPLARQVRGQVAILPQVALAAGVMFFVAHAVLFKLHLPVRYTTHSLRIVVALASAIALIVMVDGLFHWANANSNPSRKRWALGVSALLGMILLLYPCFVPFPITRYKEGGVPELYEFLAQQPQDSIIASLDEEANNLPTFAQRSVLVSEMYAIPYHVGYYRKIRERTVDLIRAQYSGDLTEVQRFIQTYGVDFWLLNRAAFTPDYISGSNWLMQFSEAAESIKELEEGTTPALSTLVERCSVFETDTLVVLAAKCLGTSQGSLIENAPGRE
ncbi:MULTISPECIES: hypothetical protein [unclassified Coleofasciculus]|uniref:hypothetical protein n=1 Tax=unclassified Coleofasciculus TaxID=2692782 RepID=UPI001881F48C|nr:MULTISPECIES: hypothetical protein [unclassified Coleofasciculus]MBE9129145.1 hypothetical protein [Coleofasciculus sp. LEGE 07081]MBE9149524.1 hypothetical protein [Coleofasciculus sp. LEGE 07092]